MRKNESPLDTLYKMNQKLIFKMAWTFSRKTGMEIDELISEFNIVFCEALHAFDSEGSAEFSTYLYACCGKRITNIYRKKKRKKRECIVYTDSTLYAVSPDPTEAIILMDNFINNENEVIRAIAAIVGVYKLPKTNFRRWLKDILKSFGFKAAEIVEAFKILKTIHNLV
jgi:RNA polymerase sigma factor (sigma-70 family)